MRYLRHSPKTVVLLGMGPSLMDYMTDGLTQEFTNDFCDEVWAINMASNIYMADVIFWMDDLKDQEEFRPGLFEVMRAREKRGHPYKVITSKAYPDIVNSYDYPIEQVAKIAIPVFGRPYLNNGVAQAIAYAMVKGVKYLKIYGADFTYPNRDYAESGRACVEAWATLATVKGMEVGISRATSLFDAVADHAVYGYKDQPVIEYEANGQKQTWSYKPQAGAAGRGVYVPEDTRNELSGRLPGTEGGPTAVPGDAATHAEPPAQPEADTAPGSGEGLRDRDRHGRAEAADHAGDAPGRAVGSVQKSGSTPCTPKESIGGPGPAAYDGPGDLGGNGAGGIPSLPGGKAKAKRRTAQKRADI